MALKGQGVLRANADKFIVDFIHNAKKINADDYFAYQLKRAYVFGSYVNDPKKEKLGDIDIAIIKQKRCWYESLSGRQRIAITRERFRKQFPSRSDYTLEASWCQEEFARALHVHKNSINLMACDETRLTIEFLTQDKPGHILIYDIAGKV